jgi:hypothetical protein
MGAWRVRRRGLVSSQESTATGPGRGAEPPSFDTTVAHPARTYNYWLGGKDNYEADRAVGDLVIATQPGVLASVRANRAFLARAVEFLAGEAGVRQFLDIGTGLPTADNTHEVAQRIAPESRIVYVDNDPIVLAHARALLDSTPEGATDYIEADARDPEAILREAARTLDFSQPVAVMMLALVHFIPDSDQPGRIISTVMDAMAPGSYLTITSATHDIDTDRITRAVGEFNGQRVAAQFILRTHDELSRYFDGLEMVEPGLVHLPRWRGEAGPGEPVPAYGGIGRKP